MICGSRKLQTRPSVIEKSRENEGRVTLQREELGVGVGLGVSRKMGSSKEGNRLSCFPGEPQKTLTCILKSSRKQHKKTFLGNLLSFPSSTWRLHNYVTLIVPIPFCLIRGIALPTKQKLSGRGWHLPPHKGNCLSQLTRMSSAKVRLQEQPPITSHKLSCDQILPNKIKFIYLRFNLILHLTQ